MLKNILLVSILFLVCLTASNPCEGALEKQVFSDDLGKYVYAYPSTSEIDIVDSAAKSGECSLMFNLDQTTYSGGAYALYDSLDLTAIKDKGAIEFWVKGKKGGEKFELALVNEQEDGKKAESVIDVAMLYSITADWQKISIPLSLFPDKGIYWDAQQNKEVDVDFDWSNFSEFKIRTRPTKGDEAIVLYFDEIKFSDSASSNDSNLNISIFTDDFPSYTYAYPSSSDIFIDSTNNQKSIVLDLDEKDYSGAAFAFGPLDLSRIKETGFLEFRAKSQKGGEKIELNLVQAAEPKVEVGVQLNSLQPLTTEWQTYKIPLKDFPARGLYWDESKSKEMKSAFNRWDKVGELKFKIRKSDNDDCVIYIDDVRIKSN
jgi:hypothetical protein